MDAVNLMINDWVRAEDIHTIARVVGVESLGTVVLDGDIVVPADDLSPIPLTEEILEKVGKGFGRGFGFGYGKQGDYRWHIEIISTSTYFYTIEEMILKIRYVHELQHALRLCGIEKEIKL